MAEQRVVNPDVICQRAIQARMNLYQGLETFQSLLKVYNDENQNVIALTSMLKNRVLELETELEKLKKTGEKNSDKK